MSIIPELLDFLKEDGVEVKQEELLRTKLNAMGRTSIGKVLGIREGSRIEDIPLTTYPLYKPFFDSPSKANLLYPASEYFVTSSGGTEGTIKWFLLPKRWVEGEGTETGVSAAIISTHDTEKLTFNQGDTFFVPVPSKPFIVALAWEYLREKYSPIIRLLPESSEISLMEKMMVFFRNIERIDIAFLFIPLLIHMVSPILQRKLTFRDLLSSGMVSKMTMLKRLPRVLTQRRLMNNLPRKLVLKGLITGGGPIKALKNEIAEVTTARPSTVYGSTEMGSASVPSVQHLEGFIFNWRVHYMEFIRERDVLEGDVIDDQAVPTLTLGEVKAGQKYQPVITPFGTDLTRYVVTDLLECIAIGDDILGTNLPVFRFVERIGKVISLHEMFTIDEEGLTKAIRDAGIRYADFTARREVGGPREYLSIYLELKEEAEEQEILNSLHEVLKTEKTYAGLSKMSGYVPVRIRLLSRGTFNRFLSSRKGIQKLQRIGMRDEALQELLLLSSYSRETNWS